jgi:hypothetical protein
MAKQKTIKELLILLKKEYTRMMKFDQDTYALCYSCEKLNQNNTINLIELKMLEKYLHLYSPNSHYGQTSAYWYRLSNSSSRQRWLNKHIKLNT